MTDIELFFKTAESEIRRKHINYLKDQKCLPDRDVSKAEEVITAKELKRFLKPVKQVVTLRFNVFLWLVERVRFIRRVKLLKRYNKGIETALKVLQREYGAYVKRMKKEEVNG